jgi:hypothetical protein
MQSRPNRIRHRVGFVQHLIVPEPEYPKPRIPQSLIADAISRIVLMLTTIHLDNQTHLKTNEIKHEIKEWMLAAKLEPRHLPATQALPQALFGIRHLTAKRALKPVVNDRTVGLSLHLNSDPDQCDCSLPFMSRRDGIPWDKGRVGVGMG